MDTFLVTRCPNCQTQFRATPEQLGLRGGVVRCGACQQIFNGHEHLMRATDTTAEGTLDHLPLTAAEATQPTESSPAASTVAPSTAGNSGLQEELDALSKAIADFQRLPRPPQPVEGSLSPDERDDDADDNATSAGLAQSAPERGAGRRRLLLMLGIALLLLTLAAQLTYEYRTEIAARSPEAARYLRGACRRLGCTVPLPAQAEALSLSSSALNAAPELPGRVELTAVLRNQSEFTQRWPALDLRLKNEQGQVVVRKTFLPGDYLKSREIAAGFPAQASRELRLMLELAGEPAAGFELELFYPRD